MQRNADGTIYCETDLPNGESLSLVQTSKTCFSVDCWDKEGNNRWHKDFGDPSKALDEYNRWVPENKKERLV